jgi:2-polyprenyl-6-methoxyphenol hydroxylase-like FAD-dependent oxidoreductase
MDPRGSGIRAYSTAGHETRRLLLARAECEVLRGVEVRGLLKDDGRVVGVRATCASDGVEREWLASCTVGDDGGQSRVRAECGILLAARGVNMDALSFGLDWPAALLPATAHIWVNPRRAATDTLLCGAVPQPGGHAAALVVVRPGALADEGRVARALEEFSARHPGLSQVLGGRTYPRDFARVVLHWGNSPRYYIPGAALIGDAAHPVTPAGGQGANLAVADARCLAEILLRRGEPCLAEYERVRRRAAQRSLALSQGLAWVAALPSTLVYPAIPTMMRLAGRFPGLLGLGLRRVTTLFQ